MSKALQNTSELTSAIDDIRHKLVEEPWFGQSTTDNIELPANDDLTHNESFESFYGIQPENITHAQSVNSPAEQERTKQPEHAEHEQEL